MSRFKCIAEGCVVKEVRSRPSSPMSCPDKNRCDWRAIVDEVSAGGASTLKAHVEQPNARQTAIPVNNFDADIDAAKSTESEHWKDDGISKSEIEPKPFALSVSVAGETVRIHKAVVLGRNGDVFAECFRADLSVSRQHCRLELQRGSWVVIAMLSKRCELNGRVLDAGQITAIPAGKSRLVLGDGFEIGLTASGNPTDAARNENASVGGAIDQLLADGDV